MHFIMIRRSLPRFKRILYKRYSQVATLEQNEYTEVPEYPPILDMSIQGKKLRERESLHKKIQEINTVEEKQIALNMPRYYGWKCVILNEDKVPYNAMPLIQCYTRSHFIPINTMPDFYKETEEIADSVVKEIKSSIEDAIAFELSAVKRTFTLTTDKSKEQQEEDAMAKCIVKQINRVITNNLSDKLPHILSLQTDFDPRHEAFWFIGGIDLDPAIISWRKQFKWLKEERLHENVDRIVQYLGSPFLSLRSRHPLKPLMPYSEAANPAFKVPHFSFPPNSVGYFNSHRHGTNIPGFWPGDIDEFGLISFHGRGHILTRTKTFGEEDNVHALHCQAMKASYGWLLAQANYQGFTTFNDITYPLVTQTVITNGRLWSLYAYQLNTIEMHGDKVHTNPKYNICFGTNPLKLYETIENGKVLGLNEEVLKMLVQFYLNTPEKRDHELKPYLGKEEQFIADIEDDKKRCWLESCYKHIMSNRPKHLLPPETYLWERIYKIQHNTRFFEAKRRPFERGINPYKRRLDEHLPPYIPKVLRSYPKSKKKFETTYYPKV